MRQPSECPGTIWLSGDAWLAGGTWSFSDRQPALCINPVAPERIYRRLIPAT